MRGKRDIRRHNDNYAKVRREEVVIYFGAYFFASEEMVEHSRTVKRVMDILGQVGGIFGILFAAFGVLAKFINRRFALIRFIN